MTPPDIHYKRSRFSTRLPWDRLYTASHFWVFEAEPGRWRVGLTKFAARMLGDIVDLEFGNEAAPGEVNLTYGTAKVLPALDALADAGIDGAAGMADGAARWLAAAQRPDGGWSGGLGVGSAIGADGDPQPSIEETAQAVAALATHAGRDRAADLVPVRRGLAWLRTATRDGCHFPAAPIGLYFARLWYTEALDPLIFTVAAIQSAERVLEREGAR